MNYPQTEDIVRPLLLCIARRSGRVRPKRDLNASGQTVYEELALHFGLTMDWRNDCPPSKSETRITRWEIAVQTAVIGPKKDGLLVHDRTGSWGVWELTEDGWGALGGRVSLVVAEDPEIRAEVASGKAEGLVVVLDEEGRAMFAGGKRFERSVKLRASAILRKPPAT